eukprot:TRINITY_DN10846_c0_g1_i1.p1 TRINITY_DN10846_c0_g1~~TRINITY_DN10846_c0_g1_i1.p1  ORF type:complete len:829 (-),score=128.45 TRINITY_DN10846_c0_g1_i1:29-2515(-)
METSSQQEAQKGWQRCAPDAERLSPVMWGITLSQLTALWKEVKHMYSQKGEDPATKTMRNVVKDLIKPRSKGRGMGYALQLNHKSPIRAEIMVSHSWNEYFEEFVLALMAESDLIRNKGIWICSFALFQSSDDDTSGPSVADQVGDDVLMGPFAQVVAQASLMLVVQTRKAQVYDRLWCILEAFIALQQQQLEVKLLGEWVITSSGLFDPKAARCFSADDEKKIRDAIEAMPGGWDMVKRTIGHAIERLVRTQYLGAQMSTADLEVQEFEEDVFDAKSASTTQRRVLSFSGCEIALDNRPIPCIYGSVDTIDLLKKDATSGAYSVETLGKQCVLKIIEGHFARARKPSEGKKAEVHARGGTFLSTLAEDPELEIIILLMLQSRPHPNIVKLHALGRDSLKGDCFLLLERVGHFPDSELFAYVQRTKPELVQEKVASGIFRGIANGIAHIHSLHIAHGDLSLDNVLLDEGEMRPVIIDFGLARRMVDTEDGVLTPLRPIGRSAGKPMYMSPEQWLDNVGYDGAAADVWSLGIMIVAMLMGASPLARPEAGDRRFDFLRNNMDNIIGQVKEEAMQLFCERALSRSALDLLTKVLIVQPPQLRLHARAISAHPWCSGACAVDPSPKHHPDTPLQTTEGCSEVPPMPPPPALLERAASGEMLRDLSNLDSALLAPSQTNQDASGAPPPPQLCRTSTGEAAPDPSNPDPAFPPPSQTKQDASEVPPPPQLCRTSTEVPPAATSHDPALTGIKAKCQELGVTDAALDFEELTALFCSLTTPVSEEHVQSVVQTALAHLRKPATQGRIRLEEFLDFVFSSESYDDSDASELLPKP